MMRMMLVLLGLGVTLPASADLSAVSAGGFTTKHVAQLDAEPGEVWQTLTGEISRWWDGDHSWSGDAANLYMDRKLGGCFCERLADGGGVEHLRIVYLAPASKMVLKGALGPLLEMGLQGTMTWAIQTHEGGTRLDWTYVVHGHLDGGFEAIAPVVDMVNGQQVTRLQALVNGKK